MLIALTMVLTCMPAMVFAENQPEDAGNNDGEPAVVLEQEEAEAAEDAVPEETEEAVPEETEEALVSDEDLTLELQSGEASMAGETPCEHVLKVVPEVKATCQKTGVKAHRQCTKCGEIFDYVQNKVIDYQTLIIPLAAHKWDAGKVVRKATSAKSGIKRYTCTVCKAYVDEEIIYKPKVAVVKKNKNYKMGSYTLRFKTDIAKKSPTFMNTARIDHIWVRSGRKKLVVFWDLAKNMRRVDGVIVLRRDGKNKIFKEVKRIKFRKGSKGNTRWAPVTKFTDKTAKKKNKAYRYILVSYFVSDGYVYVSKCSDWAAGMTSASKRKNAYKATLSANNAYMQYKGKQRLSVSFKKNKKYYNPEIRWYSNNKKIAKINKGGRITAMGVGSTTVRARLASGYDVVCNVRVVGAFTPSTPTLRVTTSTNNSISLAWTSATNATSYDLYQSDDGLHWHSPVRVNGNSYKATGLTKGHRYNFYVIARNENHGYVAKSANSNIVNKKAVLKRRTTTVSGWPTAKTLYTGNTYSQYIYIGSPDGRKAKLQMHNGSRWVTKKDIRLPNGAGVYGVNITFPNSWWSDTTKWRLKIPRSTTSKAYTSPTLTITATRRYQNPSSYVQISDTISSHGYGYYISKVLVNSNSTRSDHVEALIRTANKYLGDRHINGRSGAPGSGIDASGLVIQSCYGAGVDLWPISPSTRPANCVPSIRDSRLQHITFQSIEGSDDHPGTIRGDLVFFYTSPGVVGHVAIYLGYDKIIHASPVTGRVETAYIKDLIKKAKDGGIYGYKVAGVRRIFY